MIKRIFIIGLGVILLGGCGRGTLKERDLSTPGRALLGRWRDRKVWGWENYFGKDGRYSITVNKDLFYEGEYEVIKEERGNRSIELRMKGDRQSRGTGFLVKGSFSEDFKVLSGLKNDVSEGGIVGEDIPFLWQYLDTRQKP